MESRYRNPNIPKSQPQSFWCPITRKYWSAESVKAAHIVPQCLGEENVAHLFGVSIPDAYSLLWGPGYGFCLQKAVESRFDNARFVVVPENENSNEFKVVVLDETLLVHEAEALRAHAPSWSNINNQRIDWNGHLKPDAQMLYAHFCISLLRRRRHHVIAWERDREKFPTKVWPSEPGFGNQLSRHWPCS